MPGGAPLPQHSYYAPIVPYARYSLLCSKLCLPNRRSPTSDGVPALIILIYNCNDIVEQSVIPGDSNNKKRLTDIDTYRHNLICTYIGKVLVIAASDGVAALIS